MGALLLAVAKSIYYRNLTKPAGLIRITTYDSSERLNFFNFASKFKPRLKVWISQRLVKI